MLFLEFINDSLWDVGVIDKTRLPEFENEIELWKNKEMLKMCDNLKYMKELVFNVKAHQTILNQVYLEEIKMPQAGLMYH